MTAADVHQDLALFVQNQQGPHGQGDPIALIAGVGSTPQSLGDDPEHGAAVEAETAGLQGNNAVGSYLHRLMLRATPSLRGTMVVRMSSD